MSVASFTVKLLPINLHERGQSSHSAETPSKSVIYWSRAGSESNQFQRSFRN
jgi:hypothetical protein